MGKVRAHTEPHLPSPPETPQTTPPPSCGRCGYDLHGLRDGRVDRCPECGWIFGTPVPPVRVIPRPVAKLGLVLVAVVLVASFTIVSLGLVPGASDNPRDILLFAGAAGVFVTGAELLALWAGKLRGARRKTGADGKGPEAGLID